MDLTWRVVTESSTYELGKTLTWGSIREQTQSAERRASYAGGIIGGTHVLMEEQKHGCSELSPYIA